MKKKDLIAELELKEKEIIELRSELDLIKSAEKTESIYMLLSIDIKQTIDCHSTDKTIIISTSNNLPDKALLQRFKETYFGKQLEIVYKSDKKYVLRDPMFNSEIEIELKKRRIHATDKEFFLISQLTTLYPI